jgi:hypothetical protein
LQQSAVKHLQEALIHWTAWAAVATAQYRPQLLTRVGYLDLDALTASAAADVDIARAWIKGSRP